MTQIFDTRFLRTLNKPIRRVIIVANNMGIPQVEIDKLKFDDHDIIVQFNKCLLQKHFLKKNNYNLLFFRGYSDTGTHHGFPCSEEMFADATDRPDRYFFLFSDNAPASDLWPNATLRDRLFVIEPDYRIPALEDYPLNPAIEFSGPSSGFWLLQLFRYVQAGKLRMPDNDGTDKKIQRFFQAFRNLMLHALDGVRFPNIGKFEIILVGFHRNESGHFWTGHSWDYERRWIAAHVGLRDAGVRVLRS